VAMLGIFWLDWEGIDDTYEHTFSFSLGALFGLFLFRSSLYVLIRSRRAFAVSFPFVWAEVIGIFGRRQVLWSNESGGKLLRTYGHSQTMFSIIRGENQYTH